MMSIIKWLDENAEQVILGLLLILMTIIMSIQVIARYVFNNSLSWSEELTRYLFIWSGFLSISFTYRKRIAIRIDQFFPEINKTLTKATKIIEKAIALVFFIYMIPFAYAFLLASIDSGQLSPAMRLPMYIIQVAPLVGFSLTIVRIIQELIDELKTKTQG